LSPYVNTPTLPQSFIYSLNAAANLHRTIGTKMVMQFSYDNAGGGPEPTLTTIQGHIRQLEGFFKANADVIAAVHAGFLGTFGEWWSSTEPSVGNPTPTPAARLAVRDALMSAVDRGTPIGFRNPIDLRKWWLQPLSPSDAFTEIPQARSGVHNDCWLYDANDLGTYYDPQSLDNGRTTSNPLRLYHSQISEWTTTGGENCGDGQYKACDDVLTDGPLYHWRYRRDDQGTPYNSSWAACYPEIKRSFGYRFRLDAITHPTVVAPGTTVNVAVDLRNVGWSRIFTPRKLVVTLRNRTGGTLLSGGAGDMRFLPSQATSSTRVIVSVAVPNAGTYDVYVSMPDVWPGTKDNPDFAVRFANAENPASGQGWETANSRFKTGTALTVQ
jgi:hypothetical protein